MAVTKIHGIKTTVDKAIEYICNPDKTDQNLYISSFACSPETAALDFKYTLDHTHDCRDPHNTNKAFHLIQAFSPGEVSYEEAHQIGRELADRLLEGKYSYVLTTHTDKGHVHNHLIFCSADNITFSHYHDCKKNYWKIRNLSDTLCLEHNLSTIMPNGKKGMKYNEWAANKSESSKKTQLLTEVWLGLLELACAETEDIHKNKDTAEKMKAMMSYIQDHYTEMIAVDCLAREAHISKRVCFRLFQENLHMSPLEYMREYRLRKACMELIETEKSITEIASDCGFGSSSYFGKLFREHFNCSPVRYRGKWHDCNRNRHE